MAMSDSVERDRAALQRAQRGLSAAMSSQFKTSFLDAIRESLDDSLRLSAECRRQLRVMAYEAGARQGHAWLADLVRRENAADWLAIAFADYLSFNDKVPLGQQVQEWLSLWPGDNSVFSFFVHAIRTCADSKPEAAVQIIAHILSNGGVLARVRAVTGPDPSAVPGRVFLALCRPHAAHLQFAWNALAEKNADRRLTAATVIYPQDLEEATRLGEALRQEECLPIAIMLADHLCNYPITLAAALSPAVCAKGVARHIGLHWEGRALLPFELQVVADHAQAERVAQRYPDSEQLIVGLMREDPHLFHQIHLIANVLGRHAQRRRFSTEIEIVARICGLGMIDGIVVEEHPAPRWAVLARIPGLDLDRFGIDLKQKLTLEKNAFAERDRVAHVRAEWTGGSQTSPFQPASRGRWRNSMPFGVEEGPPQFEQEARERYASLVEKSMPGDSAGLMEHITQHVLAKCPRIFDSEGVLGVFHPVDGRVTLFSWMIQAWSGILGCQVSMLSHVALLHELAHAVIIRGQAWDGQRWGDYGSSTQLQHEVLACLVAEAAAASLGGAELLGLSRAVTERACPVAVSLRGLLQGEGLSWAIASFRAGLQRPNGGLAELRAILGERVRSVTGAHIEGDVKDGLLSGAEGRLLRLGWLRVIRSRSVNVGTGLRLDLDAVDRDMDTVGDLPDDAVGRGILPTLARPTALEFLGMLQSAGEGRTVA